jgi:hypothetical protein
MRRKAETVADVLRRDRLTSERGKATLLASRESVVDHWSSTAAALRGQGQELLATDIDAYLRRMPAVATDNEILARRLLQQLTALRGKSRDKDSHIGEADLGGRQ